MKHNEEALSSELVGYISSLDPRAFDLDAISQVVLTALSSGYQNTNFLVRLNQRDDRRFVVRFHPDNQNSQDKTAVEAQNMQLLNHMPIPKVVHVGKPTFVNSTVIIMEFIEGRNVDFNKLSSTQIQNLARVVAEMHEIQRATYSKTMGGPASAKGTYYDYLQAMVEFSIDRYLGPLDPTSYQDVTGLVEEARRQIDDEVAQKLGLFENNNFSLLHTDLGAGNVLWENNSLTLIDWEEVTFGDPADEISYIFMVNELNESHRNTFLATYLAERNDASLTQRMSVYDIKNRLFDFVWSVYQLQHFGYGNVSKIAQKSLEVYRENYRVRREALEKICALNESNSILRG